jgi:hypothetical protein
MDAWGALGSVGRDWICCLFGCAWLCCHRGAVCWVLGAEGEDFDQVLWVYGRRTMFLAQTFPTHHLTIFSNHWMCHLDDVADRLRAIPFALRGITCGGRMLVTRRCFFLFFGCAHSPLLRVGRCVCCAVHYGGLKPQGVDSNGPVSSLQRRV